MNNQDGKGVGVGARVSSRSSGQRHRPTRKWWWILALLIAGGGNGLTAASERSGKDVVQAVCQSCHGPGLNGAPKIGDRSAWAPRAEQGLSSLTVHAIQGIRNMPAHGGDPKLSDLEIARAVTYMVNQSGGKWVEPVSGREIVAERTGESVVKAQCSKCHEKGSEGAPKIGDKAQWVPRMKRGIDSLVRSAIAGHGGMPARGGEADLTDNEIRNAILYLFNPATASAQGTASAARASETSGARGNAKTVDGMDINLGFQRAESLLAFPERSAERTMHGGVPRGHDAFHVNVTLTDHASGTPVEYARVEIELSEIGLASQKKQLEPMTGAGGASYGEYVRMAGKAVYQVTVRVQRPGSARTSEARFTHRVD